ncbi:MAG TPA: TolC family protein [Desulfobacterales bacterium]|nr:TolC family protein [Desulfobacterales bacterium]
MRHGNSLNCNGWLLITISAAALLFGGNTVSARSLGTILLKVEEEAPALRAAGAAVAVRRAGVKIARSRYLGEVDAVVKNSTFNDRRLINPIGYPLNLRSDLFDNNQIGYGLRAKLPLDISGRIGAQLEAARQLQQSSQARKLDVRLRLLYETAALYHGIEGILAEENALRHQIQALDSHIQTTEAAIKAEQEIPVKKMRLITERDDVRGRLAALKGREQGLRANLAALLAARSFPDSLAPIHILPPKTACQEKLIEQRPDIMALKARINSSQALRRAARDSRLPELAVDGSWIQNQGYNGENGDDWALSVQMGMPLWDGGGRRAEVAKSSASVHMLRQQLAALRYQARSELISARAAWDAATARYQAALASGKAAAETARIQGNRFTEGLISADNLVDAEAALSKAEAGKALALTDLWRAGDSIRFALGQEPALYPARRAAHQIDKMIKINLSAQ